MHSSTYPLEAVIRATLLVVLPLVLLTAACSGSPGPSTASPTSPATAAATATATPAITATQTPTPTPSVSPATSPAGSAPTCQTSQLSLRLGATMGAAGTTYQPIVFTNHGSSNCDLRGYPGVAFVAPAIGRQVGSAASRNPQQPVTTILMAPNSSVSALLGIVNYQNFPPGKCLSQTVSGLRIYPPGDTAAAYLPFKTASAACSTQVGQLNVAAVVTGSTGQ